jgi:hypothetical protein
MVNDHRLSRPIQKSTRPSFLTTIDQLIDHRINSINSIVFVMCNVRAAQFCSLVILFFHKLRTLSKLGLTFEIAHRSARTVHHRLTHHITSSYHRISKHRKRKQTQPSRTAQFDQTHRVARFSKIEQSKSKNRTDVRRVCVRVLLLNVGI